MPAGNSSFSTLIATTLQNFMNKIEESVITNNALFYMLNKAGNVKVVNGGRTFVRQIMYKTNSSFQARASLDEIDLNVTDPISASEWNIKIIDGAVVLPYLDVAMNSGDREKLLDYVNSKKLEAEYSIGEIMGDQVFGAGTGANDFDGLQKLISETPTSQTNVGGINPQTTGNDYWRNYSYGTAVTAFNTSNNGLNALNTSITESTFGNKGPKLIITTKAIWNLLHLALTGNIRYTPTDLPLGKLGFMALQYANMPVLFDDNCPAEALYGIDTDGISLNLLRQGNFKNTEFQPSHNKLLESSLLYIFGNLTMGIRRTSFVIDSITG